MSIVIVERDIALACEASHDLGIFIGRFQPFHLGHLHIVIQALKRVNHLAILVGSCFQPRDYFNPWTYAERREMILGAIPEALRSRVTVMPLEDMTYNDGAWVVQVQQRANDALGSLGLNPKSARVALVGHRKDGTSFYLSMFPQWDEIAIENFAKISATPIREAFFNKKSMFDLVDEVTGHQLPETVNEFLAEFSKTADHYSMMEEYEYIKAYKKQFEGLRYPPIFQTVDAVVVQSGHVLLVKRRSFPGRGLWALPGGFLNADERVQDAVYRELREETLIKVPEPVLRGSTVTQRLFDDVHRSARGRTLTHAFLIHLRGGDKLPKVKGADDAEKAKWVPLAEITREMMFEDHFAIIRNLTALL